MRRGLLFLAIVTLVAVTTVFPGCAGSQSHPESPTSIVSISDIKSVAGKWAGIAKRTPPMRSDDWLEVTIKEDGAYEFSSFRTIGAATGSGTLLLKDGKLMTESDRGSSTYTLYDRGGKRVLVFNAVMKDGVRYSANLDRVK